MTILKIDYGDNDEGCLAAMFRRGSAKWKSIQPPTEDLPLSSSQSRNSKIYVIYGNSEEFDLERRTLWMDVLPELQSFAFHSAFDIEWIDPLAEGGELTEDVVDRIICGAKDDNSWLICLLGDKYGSAGPPNRIPSEEFEAIRGAIFEHATDLKLLDQHYVLDRVSSKAEYRLNTHFEDKKMRTNLAEVIRKGVKSAYDDDAQMTVARQKRYFWSPVHKVASIALDRNCRCTMVLRKFDGVRPDTGVNSKFCDNKPESAERITALKNQISENVNNKLILSHIFVPENGDIQGFFGSRDAEKYKNLFSRQVLETMKNHLLLLHPFAPNSFLTPMDVAAKENELHLCERFTDYHNVLFFQELLSTAASGGVLLIQGPDICGKTQSLCRLFEQAPPVLKIIRFIDLTYSSTFAHELWRHINLQFCSLIGRNPQHVINAITFEEQLNLFDEMLALLDDKMLYLFLDDVHLLKQGPFFGALEKRLKKLTNSNRNILVGEILLDQILQRKDGVMSGGIQGENSTILLLTGDLFKRLTRIRRFLSPLRCFFSVSSFIFLWLFFFVNIRFY
uniref:WD_REPEATS_REGION domain-containing protein n=1 Tax=Angiostrongylus cantonensis TaxID=6313 RepID=A0A0K0DMX1_ANGCA